MIRDKRHWFFRVLLICLLAALISSCTKTDELFIYEDQVWEVKHTFSYVSDVLPMLNIPLVDLVGIRLDLGAITNEFIAIGLNQLTHAYRLFGYEAEWDRKQLGDQHTYSITMKGTGYQDLVDIGLGGNLTQLADIDPEYAAVIQMLSNQVTLVEMPNGNLYLTISQPPGFDDFPIFETEYIVHAGRIISSNATTQKRTKAIWENPTYIEVEFTPIRPFWPQYWWIFAVAGGVIVVVVVAVLIIRGISQSRRRTSPRSRSRSSSRRRSSRSSRYSRRPSSRRTSSRDRYRR